MDFLVSYAVWIVIVLGAGIAGLVFVTLRSPNSSEESGPAEHPIPVRPPSVDEEDEGPRRVLVTPGAPPAAKGPEVEREYALVVNEEDLKMPSASEEAAPARRKVDSSIIREMISRQNFDEAFRQYAEKIEHDAKSEFSPDIEKRLGDHFLTRGDLEKAAKVLEHHVATHPDDEIAAETYFNLGYIHFRGKTLNKSRRYFRLFVERHKDPVQVERAQKILSRLERVHNLN